jgi:ADP-ribose pyrophosphatase YjhB (NUDIX family)
VCPASLVGIARHATPAAVAGVVTGSVRGVSEDPDGDWLRRVRALQSLAQEGLAYTRDPFDAVRFTRLKELTAEIAEALSDGEPAPLRLAVEQSEGYLTPKLDVRAAVFDDHGRVLLVQEHIDGRWSLPGGWADVGEGLAAGAVREVWEETGYVVEYERLLGVYDRERWGHPPASWYTLKAVVGCRLIGGEATPSMETDAVEWFARDEVPELSTGRMSARLLERVFEHHDDPALPPDVD